jgi:hypothetical protein
VPMFNLLLRLDRFGRLVLSASERRDTRYYGASLLLILAAAAWWAVDRSAAPLNSVIMAAMLSVCVAATVTREKPRSRLILGGATAALGLCGAGYLAFALRGMDGGLAFLGLFFVGFLGFQFSANLVKG